MLFGERVVAYCENHKENTKTVRTSEETHHIAATKPNQFGETVLIYFENHMEHTDTVCGQNAEYLMFKQVVHMSTTVR
jgi:hypothetical protein